MNNIKNINNEILKFNDTIIIYLNSEEFQTFNVSYYMDSMDIINQINEIVYYNNEYKITYNILKGGIYEEEQN